MRTLAVILAVLAGASIALSLAPTEQLPGPPKPKPYITGGGF
jgi:hypothetical protein